MVNEIGFNIKKIRNSKNITLQEVSKKSGLSPGYLSKLERNLNSPTIVNLQKICKALDINMTELLSDLAEDKICVKKDERRVIFETESHIKYELTSEGDRNLKGVSMIVDDNSKENLSFMHNTDEFGIIIEGCLEMTVDEIPYILEEGDSIYIKANTEHSFRKLNPGECVSYWTYQGTVNDITKKI